MITWDELKGHSVDEVVDILHNEECEDKSPLLALVVSLEKVTVKFFLGLDLTKDYTAIELAEKLEEYYGKDVVKSEEFRKSIVKLSMLRLFSIIEGE